MGNLFLIATLVLELRLCFSLPANFVFGDSLVDVGNNNYIATLSKADFSPNGIDLGNPTGRFTNARTIVDIIGQQLGLTHFTPPYLAPTTTGPTVLQGVNYASGGGGILTPVVSRVEQDLISPESFVAAMISRFRTQLMRLYSMGGRKIVAANVGPIGCIPHQRDSNPSAGDECVVFPNQLAQLFNAQLRSLVEEVGANLDGSKIIYADVYRIVDDIIQNYVSYGFENANSACCGSAGRFNGLIPCAPTSKVCEDRSKYVFWDPFHPADAANSIIAARLMDGDPRDIWPINIRQLLLD